MPSPLKHKGKRREVKAWAIIWRTTKEIHCAYNSEDISDRNLLAFERKEDADANMKTYNPTLFKVVPVTIIYYV